MLYLRVCYDRVGSEELRTSLREAHRSYIKAHVDGSRPVKVILAGPLCSSDSDETNLASMMIVEATSFEEVERFHEGDPFTEGGLFERVIINRWDKHIG